MVQNWGVEELIKISISYVRPRPPSLELTIYLHQLLNENEEKMSHKAKRPSPWGEQGEGDKMGDLEFLQPAELQALLRDENGLDAKVAVIDVRDSDYDEGGHIPGARNVPSDSWLDVASVDKILCEYLDSSSPVQMLVFHCMKSQIRGPTCARMASEYFSGTTSKKVPRVCVLYGGFCTWKRIYGGTDNVVEG